MLSTGGEGPVSRKKHYRYLLKVGTTALQSECKQLRVNGCYYMNECSSMEEMQCGYLLAVLNATLISLVPKGGLKVH